MLILKVVIVFVIMSDVKEIKGLLDKKEKISFGKKFWLAVEVIALLA